MSERSTYRLLPYTRHLVKLAVCDVLDALLGPRVYRREMSFDEALSSLVDGRGTLFDPDLIDALLSARQAFEELYRAMPPAQD